MTDPAEDFDPFTGDEDSDEQDFSDIRRPKAVFTCLELTNFLSYKAATLNFGSLVALVGPNASGKSNAVAAIKLLREIPFHGLATAIARRGGFDQLRHRSSGHPYNPALRLSFRMSPNSPESYYELRLRAVSGKRYEVKHEEGKVFFSDEMHWFRSDGHKVHYSDYAGNEETRRTYSLPIPPGQSALTTGGGFATFFIGTVLQSMQTVEINPARVGELQDPSSTREFEPDGSNVASMFEALPPPSRAELVDQLSAIVGGIVKIDLQRLADKVTLKFTQETASGRREFLAKQMSDGTLRAFSILLSTLHSSERPGLLIVEEPEVAIHLGALRTLVDILVQHASDSQVVITTHSADIIDALPLESLRVVWNEGGVSRIAPVAAHTQEPVRKGLITPGELLRSDALDPALP